MKLTFTNYKAIIVIISFIGRLFNAIIKEYYLTYYFKEEYPDYFQDYIYQAALSSLICVPVFSVLQMFLIDWMNKKTNMTIALVLLVKAIFDGISNYLIFYVNGNFNAAVVGLYIDFAITKGQHSLFIMVLETVVDEKASSFSVVIVAIIQKILVQIIAKLIAYTQDQYIDDKGHSKIPGKVIFYLTTAPLIVTCITIIFIAFKLKKDLDVNLDSNDPNKN